jgi:hypothetical protein
VPGTWIQCCHPKKSQDHEYYTRRFTHWKVALFHCGGNKIMEELVASSSKTADGFSPVGNEMQE